MKSYLKLYKENKRLRRKINFAKETTDELLNKLEDLFCEIESTCIQNNYNNTSYKSHKIIELIRDFEDSLTSSKQ